MKYYILNANKLAVPCDDMWAWAAWVEAGNRIVKQEVVGSFFVSTVFLGLDHNYSPLDHLPILFETMIFPKGKSMDLWMDRCGTWEEALAMHEKGVTQAKTWMNQLPVQLPS